MATIKPIYLNSGVLTQAASGGAVIDAAFLPAPSAGSVSFGSATLDFGSEPGSNEASLAITGLGSIAGTSNINVWVSADDTTSDHTAADHRYIAELAAFTAGTPTATVGFTIYGRSIHKLAGTYKVRYSWNF